MAECWELLSYHSDKQQTKSSKVTVTLSFDLWPQNEKDSPWPDAFLSFRFCDLRHNRFRVIAQTSFCSKKHIIGHKVTLTFDLSNDLKRIGSSLAQGPSTFHFLVSVETTVLELLLAQPLECLLACSQSQRRWSYKTPRHFYASKQRNTKYWRSAGLRKWRLTYWYLISSNHRIRTSVIIP